MMIFHYILILFSMVYDLMFGNWIYYEGLLNDQVSFIYRILQHLLYSRILK